MKKIITILILFNVIFSQELPTDVLVKFIPATKGNQMTQQELRQFSGNFITTLDKNSDDYSIVTQDKMNKKISELKIFTKGYPENEIKKLSEAFDKGVVILVYLTKSQNAYKAMIKVYGLNDDVSEKNAKIYNIEESDFNNFVKEGNQLAQSLLKSTSIMPYVYYGVGAALVGGGVYFLLKSLKKEKSQPADLPEPKITLPQVP
ncbi:MAG TPA: hypothetical protein PLI27_00245 [Ignavibacteriales bacterium]|nr:hypothetical protein [Ignavibacteriales bacterium]HOL81098.1 hypothetical protein [Ignavibacteriales bacterium]HOM66376.1 hypothetical protein [Ignavibacteriales bacterium]HPD66494.1 hypothetical protein [Ignavibacteriales bacterium]HPP34457.1 hypothetical protein [Ignavibacteriales bacterium]